MNRLKLCPFCGASETGGHEGPELVTHEFYDGVQIYSVKCKHCHAEKGYYATQEEAIEEWNDRYRAYRDIPIPPGDTIREILNYHKMDTDGFARFMGMSKCEAARLLTGEEPVTETIARKISMIDGSRSGLVKPDEQFVKLLMKMEAEYRKKLWEYYQCTEDKELLYAGKEDGNGTGKDNG